MESLETGGTHVRIHTGEGKRAGEPYALSYETQDLVEAGITEEMLLQENALHIAARKDMMAKMDALMKGEPDA